MYCFLLRRDVICGCVLKTLGKENYRLKSLMKVEANVFNKPPTHQIQGVLKKGITT